MPTVVFEEFLPGSILDIIRAVPVSVKDVS